MSDERKLLMIFDGGLAPGYTAVAAAMTEEAEARGFVTWAAHEGFRSLCGRAISDIVLERVVMSVEDAYALAKEGVPAQVMYRKIDDPGSDFRSERFRDFVDPELQQAAARFIEEHGFTHVGFFGGDGTLRGAKAVCEHLDPRVRVGFINLSADSDLLGDRSVGFLSALEEGSRVARGLFEDAFTHKRHYILEMMGNRGGKHALHCGASARAHLIILPRFDLDDATLRDIAARLERKTHSLTVIAEGYRKDARAAALKAGEPDAPLNAAEEFRRELARHGFVDRPDRRVVAEAFSRSLRGAPPLLMECELAYLKARLLFLAWERGESHVMAYYRGEHDHGVRPFAEVVPDQSVDPIFLDMIDRFGIPSLRRHAEEMYGAGA